MLIIGCDFHTRYQQNAMMDTETAELAGGPSFGFEFPGRVAQLLDLNFRVAAPSWFFEGAEGLLFPSDCRHIS
jgi:hypothetical protein